MYKMANSGRMRAPASGPAIYARCCSAIDGTSHEKHKPKEHQEMYYSEHRKVHCLHSQVIIDNTGMPRQVESGLYGHQNDAQHNSVITRIPDALPLPDACFLLLGTRYFFSSLFNIQEGHWPMWNIFTIYIRYTLIYTI